MEERQQESEASARIEDGRGAPSKASKRGRQRETTLARAAVAQAIRAGRLARPDQCSECGMATLVQAHHKSYAIEYWLDVEWLCNSCHWKRHGSHEPRVSSVPRSLLFDDGSKIMFEEKTSKAMSIKFTPTEYELLKAKAAKAGVPLATMVRAAAVYLIENNVKVN